MFLWPRWAFILGIEKTGRSQQLSLKSRVLHVPGKRKILKSSWKEMVCGIIGIIAANYKNPQYRRSSAWFVDIAGHVRGADLSSKVNDFKQTRADNSASPSGILYSAVSPLTILV